MIKNLIASIMMSATIGIQSAQTGATNINEFSGFYEVQNYNEYYNDILELSRSYRTLFYKNVWIGTNVEIRARAIQYLNRDIADNDYYLSQLLVMKCDSQITLSNWITQITDQAIYDQFVYSAGYSYNYATGIDTELEEFFNGKYYNTYASMETFYNLIRDNMTFISTQTAVNNIITCTNNNYIGDYIVIQTNYTYDATKINDNGAMFEATQPYTDIKQTLRWEIPPGNNGEIVDIPGMMFTILGMPFAWLSTAFNFTIFPGTMYEVNISAILMTIVLGLIVLYIVKKIIK